MEGTSCADDMRLLHERIENHFSFPLVRIWFWEAGNRIQFNVRSILGAIEGGVMVRLQVISKSLCVEARLLTQIFDTSSQPRLEECSTSCQLTALWAGPSTEVVLENRMLLCCI